MQEVEGEEFLRGLWQLLSSKEALLSQLCLTLTTLQAQFINTKFSDISKGALRSQRLAHLAKKKPLNHNELLDLQFYLEQIGQLKLTSAQETLDETTLVDLSTFRAVYQLQIIRCKPSILYNFVSLSPHLRHLTIDRSLSSVSEILKSKDGEDDRPWSQLKVLNAAHNYISSIDDSLVGLSGLELLNLSHNLIHRVENLQFCYSLVHVDLGHNRIRSVQNTVETLGNLKVLILCDNGLESTSGLEKLLGLEKLDISDNQLMQPADVEKLGLLPNLVALDVRGNPMASISKYRTQVFELILKEELALDGVLPTQSERATIEAKRAEIPLVPYAGHTTISKVGAIETAKPAFQSSGRALLSESLDPTMVYNYPQLRPDDRRVLAEVAVTAPPMPPARAKHISSTSPGSGGFATLSSSPSGHTSPSSYATGSSQGAAVGSGSSSAIAVYPKKKPNQKHPKRKVVAEILDPASNDPSVTSPDGYSIASTAKSNGHGTSSFASAMGRAVGDPGKDSSGQPEDLPQILRWAEEERWLLNYNAYRKRIDEQEAAAAAAIAGANQGNPGSLKTSGGINESGTSPGSIQLGSSGALDRLAVSPSDRNFNSSSAIPVPSPLDDGPTISGSLGSTDWMVGAGPGSGTMSRRRLPEVSRKTFMMPSTFTADMLSELDANSSDAEFQKFAESTLLAASKGSRKVRPVTTMITSSSGSSKLSEVSDDANTTDSAASVAASASSASSQTGDKADSAPQASSSASGDPPTFRIGSARASQRLMQFGSPDDLPTSSLDSDTIKSSKESSTGATTSQDGPIGSETLSGSLKPTADSVGGMTRSKSIRHASATNAILSASEELDLADHGSVDMSSKSDDEPARTSAQRDSISSASPGVSSPSPIEADSSAPLGSTSLASAPDASNPTSSSPQKEAPDSRRIRPRTSKYSFNLPPTQDTTLSATPSASATTSTPLSSFSTAIQSPANSDSLPTAAPSGATTPVTTSASPSTTQPTVSNAATQSSSPSASDLLDAMLEEDFTQLLTTPTTVNKAGVLEVDTSSTVGPVSAAAPKSTKLAIGKGVGSSASTSTAEAISSDEFLVSTPGAMGSDEWEDRIVIVNSKFLEEWDTQGSVVLRLEAKELVDASITSTSPLGPVVVLSYGNTNPRAFSPHTSCTYRMESDSDANSLLKVMKGILASSTKKLKCVTCQSVFTMQKMLECQKCNGTMLIPFEAASSSSASSSASTAASSSSASSPQAGGADSSMASSSNLFGSLGSSSNFSSSSGLPHYEDAMDATVISMNRKIYTRTMFLQDSITGEMEEMLAYFPCWFVPFGSSIQKEQRASIVLSDTKLMIFIKRRPRKGSVLAFGKTGKEGVPSSSEEDYKDEELLVSMPLRALKRILIGPFWQWIRIENATNPIEPFVMITRSHARTFRFLQFFKAKCGWVEMTNKNKEFSKHINDAIKVQLKDSKASTAALVPELDSGVEIDLYLLAYQRVKAAFNLLSAVRSTVVYGKDTTLVSRAVILTRHNILICEEDYGKWPSLTLSSWNAPKTPHFNIVQHFSYHDIVSLSIVHPNEHQNYVGLTFEFNTANGSTSQQQVILITQGDGERQKLISLVSQRYQEHFHIKLVPEQS